MAKRSLSYNRRMNSMNKGLFMKAVIIPCCIVFIFSAIYLIWFINNKNSTLTNIDYIRSFMSSTGQLRDYSNKLGMHDPSTDIKWYMDDKGVRIEFGRIVMDWETEEFWDPAMQQKLNDIGIVFEEVKEKGVPKIICKYRGLEIERWVR